jgi:hypothetical protein
MEEWCRLCPADVDYELSFLAHKAAEKRHRKEFIEAQLEGPLRSPPTTNGGTICGSPPRRTPTTPTSTSRSEAPFGQRLVL